MQQLTHFHAGDFLVFWREYLTAVVHRQGRHFAQRRQSSFEPRHT